MADGKQWFKVWTGILTDPDLAFLHNQTVGAWVRLCALAAQHGTNGKLTIPSQQLLVTLHLSNATQDEVNKIVNELKTLNINFDDDVKIASVTLVTLQISNWTKYQAYSESYERVNKFRKTKTERYKCNVEKKRREEKRRDKKRKEETTIAANDKIVFDSSNFKFTNLNGKIQILNEKYPAVDVAAEIRKMEGWLMANPKNVKSNYERFITNWLAKAQDKFRPGEVKRSWEE